MSGLKEPRKKRIKIVESEISSPSETSESNLKERLKQDRKETAASILQFKFNKNRVKVLSEAVEVPSDCNGIAYWMLRDQRVQDNWAFLFAQKLALKSNVPLHVCFCLLPKFLGATIRQFKFLLKGLREVQRECEELNIQFHMLYGGGADVMPDFIEKHNIGALVIDFMPLRNVMSFVDQLKRTLPEDVPLCQVDAHNTVPCWEASKKVEYWFYTFRPKMNKQLNEYLTQFPPVIKHPYSGTLKADEIDWDRCEAYLTVDRSVDEVDWITPGYSGGIDMLESFVNKRIQDFRSKRTDPNVDGLSNLSPWFHFGQVSAQRCILVVKALRGKYPESVDAYLEEALRRRELSDNFCFYNSKYDDIEGAMDWAKTTLDDHREDKRPYIYKREIFEKALTHDDLWNAAQLQLVKEGKMHGSLRMYWAKKILEWTANPEEALVYAIYLNDRYSLDGCDPSGYVGCMFSICGVHDHGWTEREVYGKIRYLTYDGFKKKFNTAAFITRYGGKVHKTSKTSGRVEIKAKKAKKK